MASGVDDLSLFIYGHCRNIAANATGRGYHNKETLTNEKGSVKTTRDYLLVCLFVGTQLELDYEGISLTKLLISFFSMYNNNKEIKRDRTSEAINGSWKDCKSSMASTGGVRRERSESSAATRDLLSATTIVTDDTRRYLQHSKIFDINHPTPSSTTTTH
jgi:hypothetical protein